MTQRRHCSHVYSKPVANYPSIFMLFEIVLNPICCSFLQCNSGESCEDNQSFKQHRNCTKHQSFLGPISSSILPSRLKQPGERPVLQQRALCLTIARQNCPRGSLVLLHRLLVPIKQSLAADRTREKGQAADLLTPKEADLSANSL